LEEFKTFDRQLLQNCSNLIFNKHGRHVPVPNSDEIYSRRNYVKYRLGASFQQLGFLIQIIKNKASKYKKVAKDTDDKLLFTFKAIEQVSYCLDNLIFNLASMSDYIGNYLGLLIYGPNFQTIKWNGFVKKTNVIYKDHEFGNLLSAEHKDWFDKLHNYRGDIIHRKVLLVEVDGFRNTRMLPVTVENLNFIVNDSLKKYFHVFRRSGKTPVIDCGYEFCKRTLSGFSNILTTSETLDIRK